MMPHTAKLPFEVVSEIMDGVNIEVCRDSVLMRQLFPGIDVKELYRRRSSCIRFMKRLTPFAEELMQVMTVANVYLKGDKAAEFFYPMPLKAPASNERRNPDWEFVCGKNRILAEFFASFLGSITSTTSKIARGVGWRFTTARGGIDHTIALYSVDNTLGPMEQIMTEHDSIGRCFITGYAAVSPYSYAMKRGCIITFGDPSMSTFSSLRLSLLRNHGTRGFKATHALSDLDRFLSDTPYNRGGANKLRAMGDVDSLIIPARLGAVEGHQHSEGGVGSHITKWSVGGAYSNVLKPRLTELLREAAWVHGERRGQTMLNEDMIEDYNAICLIPEDDICRGAMVALAKFCLLEQHLVFATNDVSEVTWNVHLLSTMMEENAGEYVRWSGTPGLTIMRSTKLGGAEKALRMVDAAHQGRDSADWMMKLDSFPSHDRLVYIQLMHDSRCSLI